MSKQLINKYKPEFDHWLNEGSILARVITSDEDDFMYTIWYMVDSNNLEKWKATSLFSLTNTQIEFYKPQFVINDEYSEFRKALAEGKTIQLNEAEKFADSNRGWVDLSCKSFGKSTHLFPVNYYRIKPDESKFKAGDFVRYIHSTPAKVLEINNINGNRYYFTNSEMSCLEHELEPWSPIKNEWCWFYDSKSSKYAIVSQFKETWNAEFISITDAYWKFCEPFLNSRPSYLKDK